MPPEEGREHDINEGSVRLQDEERPPYATFGEWGREAHMTTSMTKSRGKGVVVVFF